jgi:hypothetical protein
MRVQDIPLYRGSSEVDVDSPEVWTSREARTMRVGL